MPVLPPNPSPGALVRAGDAHEQQAQAQEVDLAQISLALFAAERDVIARLLAGATTDDEVRAALDAIRDAYAAPAGLFYQAWAEALGAQARAQVADIARQVADDTARVTGTRPDVDGAQTLALEQAAADRAARASADITAGSRAAFDAVAAALAPLPPDVAAAVRDQLARGLLADVGASPRPGTAVPRPPSLAVLQQRVDSLAPLLGRDAADQIVDRVAGTLALGRPTVAVARDIARDVTATPIAERRSRVIAITEGNGLVNAANFDAITAQGVLRNKRWVSQNDRRVRDSHDRCAHQGTIPLGERFVNGLLYPGERPAPASELVNCRCALSALP